MDVPILGRAFTAPILIRPLLFFALAGCLAPEPKPAPPPPIHGFSDLSQKVARVRGLAFKGEVSLRPASAESAPPAKPVPNAISGAPANSLVESVYKNVGFVDAQTDLSHAWSESRRFETLVQYDRATSAVSVTPMAWELFGPWGKGNPQAAHNAPAVLAIMEALQDQHFSWPEIVGSANPEDRRLALRAVAAGDALLTAAHFATADKEPLTTALARAAQAAAELEKIASGLPDFFRRQIAFPYRAGSQFVSWALAARGWRGVDALYENPPLSSAEILHPEIYFVRRRVPLRFFAPALGRRFKEPSMVDRVFGEHLIAGLLQSARGRESARLAAAWRGDQLFVFQASTGAVAVWFSAWEDENSAERFRSAYRTVLQTRHRVRFHRLPGKTDRELLARGRDGRAWLLEARGTVVLLAQNSAAERLPEIVADAWTDLEVDPQASEIRFESAQREGQFSSRRR